MKERKKSCQCLSYKEQYGGGGGGGGGGEYYHKQSEGLGEVLCHSPSYVTASRCARSLRLKELSE